jgi:hypothetical protein
LTKSNRGPPKGPVGTFTKFVDFNDPLIKKHGNFFQNLEKYNKSNYNLDIINQIALKSFKNFKIFNSNSLSRKILLYAK